MEWFLNFIKVIFTWAWSNKNIAVYIILAIVIAFLTWDRNKLKQKNDDMIIEAGKLPDNIQFMASMHGTKFEVTYKDSKDNTIHQSFYIPEEGGIDIIKKIDLKNYNPNSPISAINSKASAKLPSLNPLSNFIGKIFGPSITPDDNTIIKPKLTGFTFAPGIAGIWDGGFRPERPVTIGLDAKLFYYHRYSAGLGTTIDYPYVWASRHVDDFFPFITINHLELMLGYGKPYSNFSNSVFTVGGRTNF
jgi:hypothetical protein